MSKENDAQRSKKMYYDSRTGASGVAQQEEQMKEETKHVKKKKGSEGEMKKKNGDGVEKAKMTVIKQQRGAWRPDIEA